MVSLGVPPESGWLAGAQHAGELAECVLASWILLVLSLSLRRIFHTLPGLPCSHAVLQACSPRK